MIKITNSGLLTNNRNRFDALKYKTDTVKEYPDSNFTDNNCLISYKQALNPMMVVDDIAKGELCGFYVMRIFWSSDQLSEKDLEVILIRDGVEDEPIQLYGDYDYLTGGSNIVVSFSTFHENQFMIRTGESANRATIKLDYIQLDPLHAGSVINLVRKGYGSLGIAEPVEEEGIIEITGNGGRDANAPVTFRGVYKEPPSVMVAVEGYGELIVGYGSVTTTGMRIYLGNRDNVGWTSTWKVRYWVKGQMLPPIKLLTDDTG